MKWLKYLWIPFGVALGFLGWVLLRDKSRQSIPNPKVEVRAIRAEAEAKKLQIELGKEQAVQKIERQYEAEIKQLDEAQAVEAVELRKSPDKLAAFLIRAAR